MVELDVADVLAGGRADCPDIRSRLFDKAMGLAPGAICLMVPSSCQAGTASRSYFSYQFDLSNSALGKKGRTKSNHLVI